MSPARISLEKSNYGGDPSTADRFRRSTTIGIATIAGIAVLAAWFLGGSKSENRMAGDGGDANAIRAVGTLNPGTTVAVGSSVSGVIEKVLCDYNMAVKKGQLCALIDPRPYQTIVDQDRASLETVKAQLKKDQANLIYAGSLLRKNNALLVQDAISRDQVDNSISMNAQAEAQIALDRASIIQHEAALNAAEVYLGYTNIVSPIDGTVVSKDADVGQTIAASFQTPTLFVVSSDLSKMELEANVGEKDIGLIRRGDKVVYSVDAFPDRTFGGKVAQIRLAPHRIGNDVTYTVVVDIDNPQRLFRPGMTAAVRVYSGRRATQTSR